MNSMAMAAVVMKKPAPDYDQCPIETILDILWVFLLPVAKQRWLSAWFDWITYWPQKTRSHCAAHGLY